MSDEYDSDDYDFDEYCPAASPCLESYSAINMADEYDSNQHDSDENDSDGYDFDEYCPAASPCLESYSAIIMLDEHGSDEHGSDEYDSDEDGSDEYDSDEHGSDEHGSDEHGSDEHGSDEYDSDEHGSGEHYSGEHDSNEHDSDGQDSDEYDSGEYGAAAPPCLESYLGPEKNKVYIMYHGTSREAAENIKAFGFKQSAGGMLGRGVYLSRDLEKASRYPMDTPEDQRVVLEVKVNVGRVKRIDRQRHPMQKTWHDHGYDTAWCPPDCGMVRSGLEEDCVWDPERITVIGKIYPQME